MRSAARAVLRAPHSVPRRYSVFTVQSVHIPKITGDNPITIHLEAAIDNANGDEDLPLVPWH
jgi:hypothetical protein